MRSLLTIFIVFSSVNLAGLTGALPGGLNLPATSTGWLALATLVVLYGTGFIVLFISVPRLDMPRNAPVMNIEPLATLLMGWIVLVAIDPMLSQVPTAGLWWLLAGGLFYSGGVLFYVQKTLFMHHLIWHLFVLAGSVCHFLAVYWYVLPLSVI